VDKGWSGEGFGQDVLGADCSALSRFNEPGCVCVGSWVFVGYMTFPCQVEAGPKLGRRVLCRFLG